MLGQRCEAARGHRRQHPLQPAAPGGQVQRAGDRADAPVAEIEQVVGHLPRRRDIVDGDRVGAAIVHHAAEHDRGNAAALGVAPLQRRLVADRHQHHAVAGQRADARQDAPLVLRLLVAVEHDQRIAPGGDRGLRRADHAGEERIGEVGDHQRDQLAAAALEVPRRLHRRVVQRADRGQHARAQRRADIGGLVHHGRHRGGRDAGRLRHVLDRRHPFHRTVLLTVIERQPLSSGNSLLPARRKFRRSWQNG